MNNLRLISDVYRLSPLIKANISFGKEMIVLMIQQKVRWSQLPRSWYFPKISKKRGLLKTYDIKDISEPGSERK
jgi:hypothetical protein